MTDPPTARTLSSLMDKAYAIVYAGLYRHHWWWRARQHLLIREIEKIADGRTDIRILDVGCGSGLFFDRLLEFGTVEGVEPDPALAKADPAHRHRIHVGDLSSYPASDPFDLILLLDVVEHLPDPRDALARAFALLKPTGRMLITVPAFMLLWTHHDVVNEHHTRYTRGRLVRLVRDAGGTVVESSFFFHWLFPAKLAVRLVERALGPRHPQRVPAAVVNKLLYHMSLLEQRLAGPLRLPFGTSLMAVVRHESESHVTSAGTARATSRLD